MFSEDVELPWVQLCESFLIFFFFFLLFFLETDDNACKAANETDNVDYYCHA
jgi:hypothetical protein